jgi:hypothetical protein
MWAASARHSFRRSLKPTRKVAQKTSRRQTRSPYPTVIQPRPQANPGGGRLSCPRSPVPPPRTLIHPAPEPTRPRSHNGRLNEHLIHKIDEMFGKASIHRGGHAATFFLRSATTMPALPLKVPAPVQANESTIPMLSSRRAAIKILRVTGVIAAITVCTASLLLLAAPWGLYELGLTNIDGRPMPLSGRAPTLDDDLLLRSVFRMSQPISVHPLTPWSYALDGARSGSMSSTGAAEAAWLIARHYNAEHLKNRHMLWWHLSGAALTIWITRNWTADQIVLTAAELARHSPRRPGESPRPATQGTWAPSVQNKHAPA